jgi:hypothetical protein
MLEIFKDILFISFYTKDDYYIKSAASLKKQLDNLGARYILEEIESKGEWIKNCRFKINFIKKKYETNEFKILIWIDIDSTIFFIPEFFLDFKHDIYMYDRGSFKKFFSFKSRKFQPWMIGLKNTHNAFRFIEYAEKLSMNIGDKLNITDDYLLEEARIKFKNEVSFYAIPSTLRKKILNKKFYKSEYVPFNLGSSSNVPKYIKIAVQHNKKIFFNFRKFLLPKNKLSDLYKLSKKNPKIIYDGDFINKNNYLERDRVLVKNIYKYSNLNNNKKKINLYWCIRPSPGNFGDWLSPYIFTKLSNFNVNYSQPKDSELIFLGSIGRFITKSNYVFGTGISNANTFLEPSAKYIALRGHDSYNALRNSGGNFYKNANFFGDPAILLSRIFPINKTKNGKYALVRHYIHQKLDLDLQDGIDDLDILMSSMHEIENFISLLNKYNGIITTSLHIAITCHSYGIPCRLINFDFSQFKVSGDGIKYKDYYSGVNIKFPQIPNFKRKISILDIESILLNEKIKTEHIDNLNKGFQHLVAELE